MRIESAAWQIERLAETFDLESVQYAFKDDPHYSAFLSFGRKTVTVPVTKAIGASPAKGTAETAVKVQEIAFNPVPPGEDTVDVSAQELPEGADEEDPGFPNLEDNPLMKALMAEKQSALAKKNGSK